MKFPREFPRLRFAPVHTFRLAKFVSFAIISLFFLSNFAGFLFSPVFAPSVSAIASQVETIPDDIPLSGDCDLDWIIYHAGARQGVDPRFIHAVIKQESRYNPKAVSGMGAEGLMQMMPVTAKRFGLKDPFDAAANVEAGAKYLKFLLKRFNGDVSLALAGYNAGEGSVDKYKGVPPYDETQNYVKKFVRTYGKTFHPVLTPLDAKLAFGLRNENVESSSAL
jgi:soluble lytic murein transglycosylase-like protein